MSLVRKFEAIKRIQRFLSSLLTPISRALTFVSKKYADKFTEMASIPLSKWNIAQRNHMTWYLGRDRKNLALAGF